MIYKMDKKDLWNLLKEFYNTRYGKSMFVICYSLFILFFIMMIVSFFELLFIHFEYGAVVIFILSFLCLISFCIGSYAYYKELRIFADCKLEKK